MRDPRSARLLETEFGVAATVLPDLSLYRAPTVVAAASERRAGVGFGDSVFREVSADLWEACRNHPDGWLLPLRTSLKHHRFADRPWLNRVYNLPSITREAAIRMRFSRTRVTAKSDAFERILRSLSLYVTGRFHGLCLALRQRVPVVAVASNSFKNEALLEHVGLSPARLVPPERLADIKPEQWAFDPRETYNLDAFLEEANHQFATMFAEIRSILDTRRA